MYMKNQVQLITYIQRLDKGTIASFIELLQSTFNQSSLPVQFGGVHVLPFFNSIDGADVGFDPIDHTAVDPRLGTWHDIQALTSLGVEVMADFIVNHISADSQEFQDYLEQGEQSEYAKLFLSYESVFPQGATKQDLLAIYRPRPGLPFTAYSGASGKKLMWTTFTQKQIDIDVCSPTGMQYLCGILDAFSQANISFIRLDAVGYAIKKAGTSCFMLPETFDFIDTLCQEAHARNIKVLLEIHTHYQTQIDIAKKVDFVYDFCLPPLLLYAFIAKDPVPLKQWFDKSPANAITVLDTHDGIGVIDIGPATIQGVYKEGLLNETQIDTLVECIHKNCNGESLESTGSVASNLDLYQINATYYSALGCNDTHYLLSRLIQFFAPGIPQVYYVGYFFGKNDMERLHHTNVGREINRHHYSEQEIHESMATPAHKILQAIIAFRNTHPAFGCPEQTISDIQRHADMSVHSLFGSTCTIEINKEGCLTMVRSYEHEGNTHWAKLHVDFSQDTFELSWTDSAADSVADSISCARSFDDLLAIDICAIID